MSTTSVGFRADAERRDKKVDGARRFVMYRLGGNVSIHRYVHAR